MNGMAKFLVGAGVTALMAWGSHTAFGGGEAFVSKLSEQSDTAIAGTGASISFETGGALTRMATLSGDVPEDQRQELIDTVAKIPGVSSVQWADSAGKSDDGGNAGDGATTDDTTNTAGQPASAETVATCQNNIDTLLKGKTIEFRLGSPFVAATSNGLLDELAAALTPCRGTVIEISGHTDSSGSAETNKNLSQLRAERVKEKLVERGLTDSQLTATGYGSERLKNPADPRAAENRRIEFSVASTATAQGGE